MNKTLRIILQTLFFLTFFAGSGVLVHMGRKNRHETACKSVEVTIPGPHKFITTEEIQDYIDRNYGTYTAERIDSVGLEKIERMVGLIPCVNSCEAWVTEDGMLHVDVYQRNPQLRIEEGNSGCYVDRYGNAFPLREDYEAPVPVIRTSLKTASEPEWLSEAIALVRRINSDEKLKSYITSYSTDKTGAFVLHSEKNNFILGDFSDIERKLNYIAKYRNVIEPKTDMTYNKRTIDLKYKGQIIWRNDS